MRVFQRYIIIIMYNYRVVCCYDNVVDMYVQYEMGNQGSYVC